MRLGGNDTKLILKDNVKSKLTYLIFLNKFQRNIGRRTFILVYNEFLDVTNPSVILKPHPAKEVYNTWVRLAICDHSHLFIYIYHIKI